MDDEELLEKTLRASSSTATTSQDSVNGNLVPIMADSGASGHYFDDATIRDPKHRLKDFVYLATPRKIFTAGESMLDGTVEDVLQGFVADDYGN